ncbi:hypothetical protein ACH5RR_025030 [Cinchona calisaya]|uniref:SURP motif domain-containing protein n=1 Tax=Cinchona calisaya TaxID=153742 RepID=A0ABD2Z3H5_9GENT
MDSDEEDFIFYGTPIEREEEITTRKKKAVAEASGQLRTLVPWKQEVRDEEGRRRFHGAFTGGFSAGYYNTVGSKEGWTPQSFTSSRKNRAEVNKQSVHDFLDEDEKDELEGRSFGTSMQFDTFGFTAAELARKQAEKEQQKRPSAIPGPVPDEIVVPAPESIGVKLLLKMGWRRGRSINESSAKSHYDARREARKAFLALSADDTAQKSADSELVNDDTEGVINQPTDDDANRFSKSTPVYVLNPKQDLHGLGYDPFKHAPEFREKKRSRKLGTKETMHRKPFSVGDSLFGFKSGRAAPGFGIGALEDYDAEDEDVYTSGYDFEETYIEETEEPSIPMIENVKMLDKKEHGVLQGFKAASKSDYQLERFGPPLIPKDFVPRHKFTASLDVGNKFRETPPPEVPPPEDNNLKLLIDGMATLVARCGNLFEDLSRQKNQSNPLFAFLFGGNGQDYYARKLWEEKQKHSNDKKWQLDGKNSQNVEKMTAENRGRILGEKPLERSFKDSASAASTDTVNLQFNLSDTFTKPVSFTEHPEIVKPFQEDPAKQERFELFLKDKYHGGLRSKDAGGSSKMSEAARARERLDFEAAAESIEKGKQGRESKTSGQFFEDLLPTAGMQFTPGVLEQAKVSKEDLVKEKRYPKREEFQWRPSPILCKRFDLTDPYMGKPPPAPRPRSKMDTLIFMSDPVLATNVEEDVTLGRDQSSLSQVERVEKGRDTVDEEIEVDLDAENIERPVDLYKAIFSDDSDDDEGDNNPIQTEDPQKKSEAASKTLNRLIAGDFLESLGKELGLEVPPDLPYSENKETGPAANKEIKTAHKGEKDTLRVGNNKSSAGNDVNGSLMDLEVAQAIPCHQEIIQEGGSNDKPETTNGSRKIEAGIFEKSGNNDKIESITEEGRKTKSPTRRAHNWSSGSSEDERSRKRSRHQHRRSNSDSETSDLSDDSRHRSRSKEKKKRSSREKSSSRRHSKHHKHRYGDSSERDSRYGSRKEHGKDKDRRKYKD